MNYLKLWQVSKRWLFVISTWLVSSVAFAIDGVGGFIPMATDVKDLAGKGIGDGMMALVQHDVLPFLEFGGAAVILGLSLNGLWSGYREYQKERDLTPLKHAIFAAVLLIVVGGGLLYLLDLLRQANYIT